ncbi:biotin/lipoate A/B protein ligase family protein [Oesophagostomum dentatum]|uniref:Biotin/lipoate A/B protein ligase family protein n=1 Tax=Oesophagostomum dentatum TaxID=61180 RepID=A0A0B1TL85_OESDE|nr:biotin/lipoate A/B protein ligase family protein [Oesophagostomum dentatum]
MASAIKRFTCHQRILVYTGGHNDLYKRIRGSLSRLVPADRYTFFHLSADAMKRQPWVEPTTACLIIADTSELDDQSWTNMQTYFNQSGKIIFVCQNRLLASLSNCESSKKQILVYTGGHNDLYKRIRGSLSRLVPADRYTFFHLSADAMKRQPWVEPTTACLIIADTSELDDQSWTNMQTYFNQSGKIIFVCQNRLLASLSNCESSKKQADIIRMAFGSRDSVTMGKDFEQFLKKSLKTLRQTGNNLPLFLYMENSAHQAAAIFSDATSEQLLAPDSRILQESLSRVGVTICETKPPALTSAVMMASDDEIIENMMGVRYGEEIGQTPKLFLRKSEKVAEQGLPDPSENLLPVEVLSRNTTIPYSHFNLPLYFSRLQTHELGHVIMHVPVATTTINISSSLSDAIPTCDGAVVVAARQTKGQGRGGNEFVSPLGAAMFNVSTSLPRSCTLAETPSFLQHIFAVAVVDAVRRLSGLEIFSVGDNGNTFDMMKGLIRHKVH